MLRLGRFFPASQWISGYSKALFFNDVVAGIIVTVLLIPQSLAYAMLAGVPAEVGLYSSILPLIFYAFFGTSRVLSVGPVAVVSLMTATTLGTIPEQSNISYLTGAITLALLSGIFLLAMGFLRLGFVTNFLSHSVISGFISACAIIIALSQVKHLFGISAYGNTLTDIAPSLFSAIKDVNTTTSVIGLSVLFFLVCSKLFSVNFLTWLKVDRQHASLIAKILPIASVFLSILVVFILQLEQHGVTVTGDIPSGLPTFRITIPSYKLIETLALPAFLISIIGFVESISVGKTLAAKRRQKVEANQELIGLGAANIASSLSGGFPVTGGFSRSVVNFEAGASTQAASIFAAIGITVASLFLTPALYYLPKATLAATIIVAVISLIDFSILKKTLHYSLTDFLAILTTILATLFLGVETGLVCGVLLSIGLYLYNTSTPHIAEVGLLAGSEHFRNITRYATQTDPAILMLRPDESLFFPNAAFLSQTIQDSIYKKEKVAHVILMCSAVNDIDYSALEVLVSLNEQLHERGIKLHFSEIKGPVMDKLKNSTFLERLHGNIYLSQMEAFCALKTASHAG